MSDNPHNMLSINRIGLHYIPDVFHYRQKDLETWLPQLKAVDANWLVLNAPVDWAIPEYFITGLLAESIQPILRLDYSLESPPKTTDLVPLFEAYAHWGVKYAVLFDRPNVRQSWPSSGWARQDLVERFLDRYIPIANLALQNNLFPIFPALEPGGDYWDIAFLKSCLLGLQNRRQTAILDNLVLSAYAYTFEHSLNWGAGGPDRWPDARPYFLPQDAQDQQGFRIFDWYNAIVESVTGKTCPVVLLEAGKPAQNITIDDPEFSTKQAASNLAMLRLLSNDIVEDPLDSGTRLEAIPANVISCNFWLLTSPQAGIDEKFAWFSSDQTPSLTVKAAIDWQAEWIKSVPQAEIVADVKDSRPGQDQNYFDPAMDFDEAPVELPSMDNPEELMDTNPGIAKSVASYGIQHYVLLPAYDWGIADFYLDAVRPFVKKYRATVGFSLQEAALAEYVTVVGDQEIFTEEALDKLRFNGAVVERISGDGTTIASVLAQR